MSVHTKILVWSTLLVALLAACQGPDSSRERASLPVVAFSSSPITFEPQVAGTVASKDLQLTNHGPGSVRLQLGVLGDQVFGVSNTALTLDAGEAGRVSIHFAPAAAGEFAAQLQVIRDDETLALIALSGVAHEAVCTLDTEPISLGAVMVGGSRTHELVLGNAGELGFEFSAELVSGTGAGLVLEPVASPVLAPGARIALRISFNPEDAGPADATLRIRAPACDRTVPVTAKAVDAIVTASELDFGFVHPGSRATRPLLIENLGREPVQLTSLISNSGEFEGPRSGTTTLAGESSVRISQVSFTPTSFGARTGALSAQLDHPLQKSLSVAMRGWGGGPDIDAPKQVDFGSVAVGSWSIRRVRIRNAGSNVSGTALDNLLLGGPSTSIAVIGNDPAGAFELLAPDDSLRSVGLEAGAAADLRVKFKPTSAGLHSASLAVFSNDPDLHEQTVLIELVASAEALPDCSWSTSYPALEFGDVSPSGSMTRTLQVRNSGATDCHLGAPEVSGSSAFSLVAPPASGSVLAPGTTLELAVRFTAPATGTHTASLVLYSSSRSSPEIAVPVSGRSASNCLQLLPVIDFGAAALGCSATRAIDLYNACNASVMFVESHLSAGAFSVAPISPTATIAAGGKLRLDLKFQPASIGEAFGTFRLVTADGRTVVAELRGTGAADLSRRDLFQVSEDEVDVLIVGDDGSGVPNNLTIPMGANAQAFFAPAHAGAIDFHVAVTTTTAGGGGGLGPYGQFIPAQYPSERVLQPGMPNLEQLFARNLDIGIGGSGTEASFEAFKLALSPENLAGHNKGFLRSDARLHVVFMTNAKDQSPQSVAFYEEFAAQLVATGQTKSVTFSGIVATQDQPPGSGCSYDDGTAGQSTRLRELILKTGGYLKEYCEAVFSVLQTTTALAERLFGAGLVFPLRSAVDASKPIVVKIKGIVLAQTDPQGGPNWTFDAQRRAIRLEPQHALGRGDSMEVEYQGLCQP